jgi:hypothetical protein
MTDQRIGPWPLGIDQISDDADLPVDNTGKIIAARDAVNADFTREGWPDTRPGLVRLLTQSGYHSIWAKSETSPLYAAYDTNLVRIDGGNAVNLYTLPSSLPLSFDDLNGETVFSSRDFLGIIGAGDIVRPLCVPDAGGPVAAPNAAGGLYEGRYGVAMAWVDATGKEGGLSPATQVNVVANGGIRLTLPPFPNSARFARIYRTHANGRIFYKAADVPSSIQTYLIGKATLGKRAEYQYLRAMRPGDIVRYWRGRLLTVIGNTMQISEPLAYHLTSPRHGFVPFPRRVAFFEGVEGGVYVGLVGDTVVWLRGNSEKAWEYVATGGNVPFPSSSMIVSDSLFDPQLQVKGTVALWLAQNGYVIGRPDGTLSEPQAKRIAIPVTRSARTTVFNRRVLTLVN